MTDEKLLAVAQAAEAYVRNMFTVKNGESIKALRKALKEAGLESESI